MRALLLAGGRGSRLLPFTTVFPKPLAPVGDRPIVEILLRQLAAAGFIHATLSVGYLGRLIQAYIDTIGGVPGLEIDWLEEGDPLGTAGPAGLLADRESPILSINADILTDLDFRSFAAFFAAEQPALAAAVAPRENEIGFGVLETDAAGDLTDWVEKPRTVHLCSMGVNWLGPAALQAVVPGERLDMPDLARQLIGRGDRVATWRWDGYWRDIGRVADYELAQAEFAEWGARLLPAEG